VLFLAFENFAIARLERNLIACESIIVVHWSETVLIIVPTNVPALPLAGILIITEVNSSEHPRIGDIIEDVPENRRTG
jgi:hypothetical protein